MRAFRPLALAYALACLLIAPAWLAADELPPVAEKVLPSQADKADEAVAAETAAAAGEQPAATKPAAKKPAVRKPAAKKSAAKEPVAETAASSSVTIKDFEFAPATITVSVGDTVTWTNAGPTGHSATADDGSFDTGIMSKGESGSHTFTDAGTFSYICTPHPNMTGKVIVKGESASSDSGSDAGSGDDSSGSSGGGSAGTSDTGDEDSSGSLPATGGEALLMTLLGLATLGTGLLLRRRATR